MRIAIHKRRLLLSALILVFMLSIVAIMPSRASAAPVSGVTYKLINPHSGKALDVTAEGTADGTNVEIWTDSGSVAQSWQVIDVGGGAYKLINPNSGKALDVQGAGTADGTNVQIYTDNGTSAQKWQITLNADGTYKVINVNSGKALDVTSNGTADGTNVEIWTDNGFDNQKWQLVPISYSSGTTAAKADDFLNSIGANTHMGHGTDSASQTATALSYAGIRVVREGDNASSTFINDLIGVHNSSGVKFVITRSGPDDAWMTDVINGSKTLANSGALLAMEGPNEPNNWAVTYQGSTSTSTTDFMPVAKWQRDFYSSVKSDPVLSSYPVFSSSEAGGSEPNNVGLQFLTIPSGAGALLPAGTKFGDFANVHNYISRQASIIDNMAWDNASSDYVSWIDGIYQEYGVTWRNGYNGYTASADRAALPKVTTETGWTTGGSGSITQAQQGKLYLNMYLSQFKRGFKHTFIYMLRDTPLSSPPNTDNYFGIFDSSYNAKLAATYLHNMTTILADSGSIAVTGKLNYSIPSQPSTVHDLLLQKKNGKFELVVWNEKASGSNTVTVNLGATIGSVKRYDPTSGTSAVQSYSGVNSVSFTLSDHPQILELQ
ncbi:ricin-type beta-trefoil lectin protein [Paenibacillus taihuensis]|uniref:Ricin-type beta-trefoil lectin protein n=1 Tax=Paenibacillus taihuensis TaxID=1156355 RepID=A0A3D9SI80_9BACL|nr:RICIN domain-containing protein [Paenibacillus taihuensis]REE91588.1 ricin-type beta-trefoil lectin protein [Paenibacillus taihuensis]